MSKLMHENKGMQKNLILRPVPGVCQQFSRKSPQPRQHIPYDYPRALHLAKYLGTKLKFGFIETVSLSFLKFLAYLIYALQRFWWIGLSKFMILTNATKDSGQKS
ncbi:7726_t:CDS:1 [Acaulospora colombiana]|uniref:7726_t:CDS:1 n=1 Tax=Acaulospora colombiana TaxID=27376 RepID=A0ACA9KEK5_9GLOM|nr:7726_t:CDS:1 [Acaulospora colombiana]